MFPASRFMAYHTPLTNSQEFTAALLKSRELAHNITMGMRQIPGTSPDFEVFPYTYVPFLFPNFTSPSIYSTVKGQIGFIMSMALDVKSVLSHHYFAFLLVPGSLMCFTSST